MTPADLCPSCGGRLEDSEARAGRCPSCLLELALGAADDDGPGEEPAPDELGDLEAGASVGPYRIVRTLGEGGMGVVYLAEQTEPIRRSVALKIIKTGMDTRQVVARFAAERQALALMDHPAIAKVFDAGETPRGRPYFAMEHIEGEPITSYCDRNRLTTRERLELFMKVCGGVQHAHHKGVIHRDLKPSNVLVARADGLPVPKIIDFGVAKATEQRLTERTLFTEMGVMIGTPEYMSPEQAELTPLDVDTRTDVYSLGVLLYQLLTGALPFDPEELRSAGFDEIRRKIREDEPSRPSTKVSTLGEGAAVSAQHRRVDVPTLRRELAGDLDWVTMKALEKERGRRYDSPAELAADIRRHLVDEPVLARPPSATYQLRKLILRHKLATAFVTTVFLLLVGFGIWMSLLYGRSQANLTRALEAEAEAAREAETAKRVSDFMVGVFDVSDPRSGQGETVTAGELLEKAAGEIEAELADQPEIQATLMSTMGNAYIGLGLYDRAGPLLHEALERRRGLHGEDSPEFAISLTEVASLDKALGRHDEAEKAGLRALEIQEAGFGLDHPDVAETLDLLAGIYWRQGRSDESAAALDRCIAIREKEFGARSGQVATTLNSLGNLYLYEARYEEAESVLMRALEIREEVLGPEHPHVAGTLGNLAELYSRQARYDEAEPLFHRSIAIKEKVLGAEHPNLAYGLNNLGTFYSRQQRYDEAEPLFLRAIEIREATLPSDHELIAWTVDNLGLVYLKQGRWDEADVAFRRSLQIAEKAVGPDHIDYAIVLNNIALLRRNQERYDEAETLFRQTNDIKERALGPDHPDVAFGFHNLGEVYAATGRDAEAESHYRRALEIRVNSLGPDHPLTESSRRSLAELLRRTGRDAEADAL